MPFKAQHAVCGTLAPIKPKVEPIHRYNYFIALLMKKILTANLVAFCIIFFLGPHGMGFPVILIAISGMITSIIAFDLKLLDTLIYSLLIIVGFIGTFWVSRKLDRPHSLFKATVAILLLNMGLVWLILDMSDSVNSAPIYTSIPFWITSIIAIILILRKAVETKRSRKNS